MSYYFRVSLYPSGSGCLICPLHNQKRKGRNLGRQQLVAQWKLPKLNEGDIVEVEDVRVRYSLGGGSTYEPKGYVRRVAREKFLKPRKPSNMFSAT